MYVGLFSISCDFVPRHIISLPFGTCPEVLPIDIKMVGAFEERIVFYGNNWEDLDRLVALARLHFLQDSDYDADHPTQQCAFLAGNFGGPALDWVSTALSNAPAVFNDFDGFVVAVKQAFGVEANGITALRRAQLDQLRWGSDVPVFFAEFDRLTLQLGVTGHETKINMVHAKLPLALKAKLAEQALGFANYDTMRERLITMWALDPHRNAAGPSAPAKKSRCGSCGKKGHTAKDCRGGSKN